MSRIIEKAVRGRTGGRKRGAVAALLSVLVVASTVTAVSAVPAAMGAPTSGTTPIDSCTVITEPGEYELTSDIGDALAGANTTNGSRAICIDVRTSDVTIDGNGHAIDGPLSRSDIENASSGPAPRTVVGVGINVRETGRLSNVTVSNVTTTDFYHGVLAENVSDSAVRNVTSTDNGGGIIYDNSSDVTVADSNASNNVILGVITDSRRMDPIANNTVVGNTLRNNGVFGVAVFMSDNSTVEGNVIEGNLLGVLTYNTTNTTVADNWVTENAFVGVLIEGETLPLLENESLDPIDVRVPGAATSRDNRVVNNTATDNGFVGIAMVNSTNTVADGNDVSETRGESPFPIGFEGAGVIIDGGSNNTITNTTALGLVEGENVTAAYAARNTTTNTVTDLRTDSATVSFEAGNVSASAVESMPAPSGDLRGIGSAIHLNATGNGTAVDLRVLYDDESVAEANVDEDTLALYAARNGSFELVNGSTVDTEANAVNGTVADVTDGVVAAPLGEPTDEAPSVGFDVSNLDAPATATLGETVTVTANVTNLGGEDRTERVEFRVQGDVVDSERLTLAPGESRTVQFELNTSGLAPGRYNHAVFTDRRGEVAFLELQAPSFGVSDLQAPQTATAGETVDVSALVSNPAAFESTQPVEFRLDGDVLVSRNVTLDAGQSRRVAFEVSTAGLDPGVYIHGVFTRDEGEFGVLELEEGRRTATPTPTPTPTPAPNATATPGATNEPTPTPAQ